MSLVHSEEDYRSYQLFIAFEVLQACRKWEQLTRLGGSGTGFVLQLPVHSQDSFHLFYWSDKCFGNSAAKAFFTSSGMRAFFCYLVIEILKQKLENRSNNPDVGTLHRNTVTNVYRVPQFLPAGCTFVNNKTSGSEKHSK